MELTNPNEIKPLLARHGFHFSKSLGQNFLVAKWVPEKIADSSGVDMETSVLEIGPGIGVLTKELAQRACKVTAVELDGALIPLLGETLADYDNISVVNGDILKFDLEKWSSDNGSLRPAVCANLPYNITSPVLTFLLSSGKFDKITVMIQKEVADRIAEKPGSKTYGILSVLLQAWYDIDYIISVGSGAFAPPPKVQSAVIRLRRNQRTDLGCDEKMFKAVVKTAFNQRRKTLRNALKPLIKEGAPRRIRFSTSVPNACLSRTSSVLPLC